MSKGTHGGGDNRDDAVTWLVMMMLSADSDDSDANGFNNDNDTDNGSRIRGGKIINWMLRIPATLSLMKMAWAARAR